MKLPVFDLYTDTVAYHVVGTEPRPYGLAERQENGACRIEVIHIPGQSGAVAISLACGLTFCHGGGIDSAGVAVNLYGILLSQKRF